MNIFRQLFSAVPVFGIKLFSLMFYRTDIRWITPKSEIQWEQIRIAIILNHTSLFEPLLLAAIPNRSLWRAIRRVVVPIADVTMSRPIVGGLFRWLIPNAVAISRKRDESWLKFINTVRSDSLVVIFPEGRMKRLNGLDKHGKPMSVKGGVVDILQQTQNGKLLIVYSGGLHHVQAPGQLVPRLFQSIRVSFEELDIQRYLQSLGDADEQTRRAKAIGDLSLRMKEHCT
jgi:1-acyl-sn-glycerol-3-phosphate acyltransferase